MTETMKEFKPPFTLAEDTKFFTIIDANRRVICECLSSSVKLICDALNFYYAKKGEKE